MYNGNVSESKSHITYLGLALDQLIPSEIISSSIHFS